MNLLQKIEAWIAKEFTDFKSQGAKIAVAITEDIQTALKSGIVGGLADVVSAVFPSVKNIPQEIVAELQLIVPKILAAELALQGLPANPQPADLDAFATNVLASFNVKNNNSKLYTTLAAQVYGILQADTTDSFASLVNDVEQAFQDFQQDQADAQAAG